MKQICSILLFFLISAGSYAQNFADYFQNKTLRVDYIFTGNNKQQAIYLDELSQLPSWAGREHHLSELPLEGNGQIIVRDLATRQCIYKTSFSSLFQEWLSTDEAKETAKGFENTFLLPYPKQPAEIEIVLFSPRKEVMTSFKHIVRPDDILIHKRGTSHVTPHRYMLQSGNEKECIDVAILAEGYTEKEMDLFYQDAQKACESLFSHEPFRSMKNKFNVVAVASPSIDSGVSVPRENQWKHTAVHSHFDTFYSDRYLTTSRVKAIHNTEEQGIFFVYLQLDEEGYKKQEVTLGADNGKSVQILTGIKPGDRVVTEGAYQVRLASASNAIPAHSHEH